MKLFKCTQATFTVEVVELDRKCWKVLPPKRWQIALTVAGIVLIAIAWSVLS